MSDSATLSRETAPAPPSKRDLIVAAALKLFLKTGYAATSMDAIAQEAGVSKQTVYSHHSTKKALFAAVIGDMCRKMGGLESWDEPPEGPPEEVLGTFGHMMLDVTRDLEAMAVFRVVLAESPKVPELAEILWDHGHQSVKSALETYLAGQVRQGALALSDPGLAAEQFMGMVKYSQILAAMLTKRPQLTEAETGRIVRHAVDLFLNGVGPERG